MYNNLTNGSPSYVNVDQDTCKKITREQSKYIEKCLRQAYKSTLTQKHGCVLVRNKEIISCGYNYKIQQLDTFLMKKKSKLNETYSVHAEISTIKKVKNIDFHDCELYVVRLGPIDITSSSANMCNMKYSHPCKTCASYISTRGIRKVYYSIHTVY